MQQPYVQVQDSILQDAETVLLSTTWVDTEPIKPQEKQRLQCLDVFRGLTMIGMILVDNQGGGDVIWPLNEVEWNGISTADMVFPSFLFINGMAIYLAIKPEIKKDKSFYYKLIKRVLILFLLGLWINLQVKNFNFKRLRIMGVLQRISLCYCVVVLMRTFIIKKQISFMVMSIFPALYLALMLGIDVPDCGKGILTKPCNFGGYVDRFIFGRYHMIYPNDPEGLVSTLNAIFNTYMGMFYMEIFTRQKSEPHNLIKQWGLISAYLIIQGFICEIWMPFNKKIWSTSFALLTTGISGAVQLFCYLIFDLYKSSFSEKIKRPFIWLGMNPLFIFFAMLFVEVLFISNIKFQYDGAQISLWKFINDQLFLSWLKFQWLSSLVVSLVYLFIWTLVAKILYDRKIFIKI